MVLHPWVQLTVDRVVWLYLFNGKKKKNRKSTYKQTCGLKPGHSRVSCTYLVSLATNV